MKSGRKSMSPRSSRSLSSKSPNGIDMNTLLVCILVIFLIIIGLYYLIKDNKKTVRENFESQPASLNNLTQKPNPKTKELVIILFYVDWCPHCVSTKPEWETLVNNMNNKNINGTNVKVQACNAEGSAVEKEFANENNVQGYPTIKLIKENEVVEYNGARNVKELEAFIKENA